MKTTASIPTKFCAVVNTAKYSVGGLNNSTQLDEHLWTEVLKHLSVHIYLVTSVYQILQSLDSRTDLLPIPVRSAVKLYKTSWCIQNLSKRALNRRTVSTSTTELGRLFQILTIRARETTRNKLKMTNGRHFENR